MPTHLTGAEKSRERAAEDLAMSLPVSPSSVIFLEPPFPTSSLQLLLTPLFLNFGFFFFF